MQPRKIKLSWRDLEKMLQDKNEIMLEEHIKEITLVKPKEILIYLQK